MSFIATGFFAILENEESAFWVFYGLLSHLHMNNLFGNGLPEFHLRIH